METHSIQSILKPAFEEIARRSKVAMTLQSQEDDVTYFARTDGVDANVALEIEEQDYVLLSMGTEVLAPRPLDRRRPALRVYGAFSSREDAVEHASLIDTTTCSLVIVRRNEWIMMPQSLKTRDDVEFNRERVKQKLALDEERRIQAHQKFEEARKEHRPCELMAVSENDDDKDMEDAEVEVYGRPKRLRAGCEVRGQTVFAFCTIPDKQEGECLIKILGCFETTSDANGWVRNVGSRDVVHHAIYVSPTCEWLYPNGVLKAGKKFYRVDELQRIMDAFEQNAEGVRTFKEWKARGAASTSLSTFSTSVDVNDDAAA